MIGGLFGKETFIRRSDVLYRYCLVKECIGKEEKREFVHVSPYIFIRLRRSIGHAHAICPVAVVNALCAVCLYVHETTLRDNWAVPTLSTLDFSILKRCSFASMCCPTVTDMSRYSRASLQPSVWYRLSEQRAMDKGIMIVTPAWSAMLRKETP